VLGTERQGLWREHFSKHVGTLLGHFQTRRIQFMGTEGGPRMDPRCVRERWERNGRFVEIILLHAQPRPDYRFKEQTVKKGGGGNRCRQKKSVGAIFRKKKHEEVLERENRCLKRDLGDLRGRKLTRKKSAVLRRTNRSSKDTRALTTVRVFRGLSRPSV